MIENSQLVGMVLTSGGFNNIRFVGDGISALNLIEQWVPDIVLMDVMLPGIDGLHLCKIIKQNPKFNNIKIIITYYTFL